VGGLEMSTPRGIQGKDPVVQGAAGLTKLKGVELPKGGKTWCNGRQECGVTPYYNPYAGGVSTRANPYGGRVKVLVVRFERAMAHQ